MIHPLLLPLTLTVALAGGGWTAPAPAYREVEPCEVPIRWRLADLDPRFGLTDAQAADAIRQAGMLWEDAIGRPLLFQESGQGIPVRFIFDARQEAALERRRAEEAVEMEFRRVREATAALENLRTTLDRNRTAHDRRALDFRERLDSHGRAVDYWNQSGGAPPAEFERLRGVDAELEELRRVVNEEAEAINRLVGEVNAEADRINREVAAANALAAEMQARFPRTVVESAQYRESRGVLGGLFGSSSRALDVFHFEDLDHLVRVLAHEFGHALGLDHSDLPTSLMYPSPPYDPEAGRPRPDPSDAQRLRALCPAL